MNMSKDYDFKPPYETQAFRDLMVANGVTVMEDDPIYDSNPEKWRSSFGLTFDGKNFIKAWTSVDKKFVDHVTRYGMNDSEPFIELFQKLGHDIDFDRDL
jgi:hypothetical protein